MYVCMDLCSGASLDTYLEACINIGWSLAVDMHFHLLFPLFWILNFNIKPISSSSSPSFSSSSSSLPTLSLLRLCQSILLAIGFFLLIRTVTILRMEGFWEQPSLPCL